MPIGHTGPASTQISERQVSPGSHTSSLQGQPSVPGEQPPLSLPVLSAAFDVAVSLPVVEVEASAVELPVPPLVTVIGVVVT